MRGNSRPRPPEAGISLVEVLVVLAIVSVLAGALGLSIGAARRTAGPSEEAARLVARLARAGEIAEITGTAAALIWDDRSYRFVVPGAEGWQPHPDPTLGRRAEMPGDLRLGAPMRDIAGAGGGRFVLRPDALPAPDTGPLELVFWDGGAGAGWLVAHNGATGTARPMTEVSP